MKNIFLVVNKEKIYAYVVSILTIVTLFFMSTIIGSEFDETESTVSNSIENSISNNIGNNIESSIGNNIGNRIENSIENNIENNSKTE